MPVAVPLEYTPEQFKSTKEKVFEQIVGFSLSDQYFVLKSQIDPLLEKVKYFSWYNMYQF